MSRPPFRTHLGRLYAWKYLSWLRYARRLVANEADAEDVVQDAACDSLRADPEVKSEGHANAYMFAAIRSKAHRDGRKRRAKGAQGSSWTRRKAREPSTPSPADIAIRLEEEEEARSLQELAKQAIGSLPEELREVLLLLFIREPQMKLREVAEAQGISISAISTRLSTATDTPLRCDDRKLRNDRSSSPKYPQNMGKPPNRQCSGDALMSANPCYY